MSPLEAVRVVPEEEHIENELSDNTSRGRERNSMLHKSAIRPVFKISSFIYPNRIQHSNIFWLIGLDALTFHIEFLILNWLNTSIPDREQ
jgi:hypothetical protein